MRVAPRGAAGRAPGDGIMIHQTLPQDLRTGNVEVRLAASEAELAAAQRLRYTVFYEEMGARPTPEMQRSRRDFDEFDAHCDHLLVIDHQLGAGAEGVVGTYRLMRRQAAERVGRFYSVDEYDLAPVLAYPGEILELGRSCVHAAYRNRGTMQLLWGGISAYVFRHRIDLMFGCASLPGIDPSALAMALSYLHHHHLAPEGLRPRAVPNRYERMDLLPPERVDPRAALADLPPLVKGYLRLGGFVGDGAVIDHQFNTTDVCVIVKTDLVSQKYYRHYERKHGDAQSE